MKKLKILVIDSSPIIYIGLKSVFKNSNLFDVTTFIDIKNNIIDVLNEFEIDIIISEINLKDSSVYDILKVLRKNKIEIPIVIFTSENNESKSVKILKSGASGFMTKNLKKKNIRKNIKVVSFSKY